MKHELSYERHKPVVVGPLRRSDLFAMVLLWGMVAYVLLKLGAISMTAMETGLRQLATGELAQWASEVALGAASLWVFMAAALRLGRGSRKFLRSTLVMVAAQLGLSVWAMIGVMAWPEGVLAENPEKVVTLTVCGGIQGLVVLPLMGLLIVMCVQEDRRTGGTFES